MPDYVDTRGVISDICYSEALGISHILAEDYFFNYAKNTQTDSVKLISQKQKNALKTVKYVLDKHNQILDDNNIFSFPSITMPENLERQQEQYLDPNKVSDAIYITYKMAKNMLSICLEKKENKYDYSFTCISLIKDLLIKHFDKLDEEIQITQNLDSKSKIK